MDKKIDNTQAYLIGKQLIPYLRNSKRGIGTGVLTRHEERFIEKLCNYTTVQLGRLKKYRVEKLRRIDMRVFSEIPPHNLFY